MLIIGKTTPLKLVDIIPYGAYLESEDGQRVMLPAPQLPKWAKVGQMLDVVVYHDHDGQLIATSKKPKAELGQCAMLEVVSVTPAGAFLNWGLDKDLLVPNKEQAQPMKVGQRVLVYIYQDEQSERLLASSKLHHFLSELNHYFEPGESVSLLIAQETELGFKAVIDNTYLGLLYKSELFQPLRIGQTLDGLIKHIRDDGKIDLQLPGSKVEDRDELSEKILAHLREQGGSSTLTDKADPAVIKRVFQVSKGAYKKALGSLYKQQKITLTKAKISLID